jgi:hypothetical protein
MPRPDNMLSRKAAAELRSLPKMNPAEEAKSPAKEAMLVELAEAVKPAK